MQSISERFLNTIRGKALVGHASRDELDAVLQVYDRMVALLDATEQGERAALDSDDGEGKGNNPMPQQSWRDGTDFARMSVVVEALRKKAPLVKLFPEEVADVFNAIEELELVLDEGDDNDRFGTEGWRHHFGWN